MQKGEIKNLGECAKKGFYKGRGSFYRYTETHVTHFKR